jgi:MFS family permease
MRKRLLAGISSNVLVLGFVSLMTDASSEMIYAILPLFLISIGASGLLIGIIEGAAETTASLLKVVSGWYSDRYRKRKVFILGGYGMSSFVKPALIFATHPLHVLAIRITERLGKGIRSAPRDALIADSTDASVRGKAYGFHKAMDSTGAVIGPIAVLIILALAASMDELERYRLIFAIATIPAFIAILIIVLFVREKEAEAKASTRTFLREMRHLEKRFVLLLVITGVFYVGEISYAFFVLQGQAAGLSDPSVISLYVLYNVIFVVTAIPSGSLSDRLGRRPIIAASFLIFAGACSTMSVADSLPVLALGFALFGFYRGASEGVFKAYVVDVVPSNLRATALGTFHTVVGLVMLPGGLVAGILWDVSGPWATFTYGAVMAVASTALLLAFGPRDRKTLMSA